MQTSGLGWLLLVTPVALGVAACGDTKAKKKGHFSAEAGAFGDDTGGTANGGSASGGTANGGTSALGGREASGASSATSGETAAGADAGAGDAGGTGAGGADSTDTCSPPTSLSILGSYVAPNGDQLWLRDSGKAVTLTRVPSGVPSPAKLPSLWQVARVCADDSALLLKTVAGSFTRLDYLKGASSLTLCLANDTAASLELAAALTPADRTNTIDAGCNGEPWTRVTKGAN